MSKYSATSLRLAVEQHFEVVPSRCTKGEIVFLCPSCGDTSGNRSVNVASGLTNCWRCGSGGDFIRWCRRIGHEVDIEAPPVPTLNELSAITDSLSHLRPVSSGFVDEVKLPRGFTPLTRDPDCAYAKLIGRMAVRKRLTLQDFMKAGVGFTRDDPKWEPYAIFPNYEWGRVTYYQGRTYTEEPTEGSTKLFPSRAELPLGSGNWVYNVDKLRDVGGVAVIVEAILNVLSLERELAARGLSNFVPVAIYKHKVSPVQLRKILACKKLTEVAIMYDGGFVEHADADTANFKSHVKTSVVELPGRDDPNDDAAQAVDQLLARRAASRLSVVF